MDAAPRLPLIVSLKPRNWFPLLVLAVGCMSAPQANDHVDNPRRSGDLTPAERFELPKGEKRQAESDIPLPAFPRAQNLIPVRADSGHADYRYYIDVDSVSLLEDEVTRYTIVIQSPSGEGNVIYEGIRCATEEAKILAFGTKEGRFARIADPKWTYFYTPGAMGYRRSLVELYVCDEDGWALDSDAVLERLVMHDPRRPRFAPKRPETSD